MMLHLLCGWSWRRAGSPALLAWRVGSPRSGGRPAASESTPFGISRRAAQITPLFGISRRCWLRNLCPLGLRLRNQRPSGLCPAFGAPVRPKADHSGAVLDGESRRPPFPEPHRVFVRGPKSFETDIGLIPIPGAGIPKLTKPRAGLIDNRPETSAVELFRLEPLMKLA